MSLAAAPATAGESSVSVERAGEVCRLSGVLDFDTARRALESVVPMIESGAISSVDLAGVTRSNSAGLALMVEWLATARRAERPLAFGGVSEGLRQLAGVCQVEWVLGGTAGGEADPGRSAATG